MEVLICNCICFFVFDWDFKSYFGCKYDMLRIIVICNKVKYIDGCFCFDDLVLENVKIIKNKIK